MVAVRRIRIRRRNRLKTHRRCCGLAGAKLACADNPVVERHERVETKRENSGSDRAERLLFTRDRVRKKK